MKIYLDSFAVQPERAHSADAGLDLKSPSAFILKAHHCATVDTGVHVSIPKNQVGLIKSKSGLNIFHEILTEGVIDSGFSGSIKVKLYNNGVEDKEFHVGDKIAQLLIMPVKVPALELVSLAELEADCLKASDRGANGWGSTGR